LIATIQGEVSEKVGDSVIIELGGIGYGIVVPVSDWGLAAVGKPAKFYIYEHIREDTHNLFGFSTLAAKQLFMQLMGVSGVGPKVAMQVMSAANLERLISAIAAGDPDLLKGVSGVGKKTAERIMIELRGKVQGGGVVLPASSGDPAYQALLGLGYSSAQASEAVSKIDPEVTSEQERVKAALKQVS
jgi:Holliday junction DNA helicase RuvA